MIKVLCTLRFTEEQLDKLQAVSPRLMGWSRGFATTPRKCVRSWMRTRRCCTPSTCRMIYWTRRPSYGGYDCTALEMS